MFRPLNYFVGCSLPGAPLTHDSAVMKLLDAGVNVGIGVVDAFAARNTRFEAAWVRPRFFHPLCLCSSLWPQLALNSFGEIGRWRALALVTINLERALGVGKHRGLAPSELVAYEGGDWMDFESKVVGIFSSEQGISDLF